jgi:hypothetical protein
VQTASSDFPFGEWRYIPDGFNSRKQTLSKQQTPPQRGLCETRISPRIPISLSGN